MILAIECVVACVLFGTFIILSVLKNKVSWINEYQEPVKMRYIELHPDSEIKEPEGLSPRVIARKLFACFIFLVLLVGMVYLAGAESFTQGTLFCYTIWFVVNVFDAIVIDLGVMVHWKSAAYPEQKIWIKSTNCLQKRA